MNIFDHLFHSNPLVKLEAVNLIVPKLINCGGTYVLVSAGLSMDDKIAFPYSKSVKEGMKTKEGSLDEFMGYDSTSYGGLG